jgi:hypothetical protein
MSQKFVQWKLHQYIGEVDMMKPTDTFCNYAKALRKCIPLNQNVFFCIYKKLLKYLSIMLL